jgi:hypothetical protein
MSTAEIPGNGITFLLFDEKAVGKLIRANRKKRRSRRKEDVIFWTGIAVLTIYIIRSGKKEEKRSW